MADHWHISSLEVKAFKSFGPAFSTFKVPCSQLVGVVGPNGCGKSNLLEVRTANYLGYHHPDQPANLSVLTLLPQSTCACPQAICFAAAGSTSVLRTTGRSLQDVTSTDAGSQVTTVRSAPRLADVGA
jgi:ABC-type uncharacterized transport system ATPase subunit